MEVRKKYRKEGLNSVCGDRESFTRETKSCAQGFWEVEEMERRIERDRIERENNWEGNKKRGGPRREKRRTTWREAQAITSPGHKEIRV